MAANFYNIVDRVSELLRQRGRVSYRGLKREFDLDDAALDDLKFELIEIQRVALDRDGTSLVLASGAKSPSPDAPAAPAAAPSVAQATGPGADASPEAPPP